MKNVFSKKKVSSVIIAWSQSKDKTNTIRDNYFLLLAKLWMTILLKLPTLCQKPVIKIGIFLFCFSGPIWDHFRCNILKSNLHETFLHFSLFLAENILFVFDYIPTLSLNEDYLLLKQMGVWSQQAVAQILTWYKVD